MVDGDAWPLGIWFAFGEIGEPVIARIAFQHRTRLATRVGGLAHLALARRAASWAFRPCSSFHPHDTTRSSQLDFFVGCSSLDGGCFSAARGVHPRNFPPM